MGAISQKATQDQCGKFVSLHFSLYMCHVYARPAKNVTASLLNCLNHKSRLLSIILTQRFEIVGAMVAYVSTLKDMFRCYR